MSIDVSAQDVTNAENFLAEYLKDKVPEGDYTPGSALRDLVVKAVAYNYAYLRKTADQLRVRQSLLSIDNIDVSDDQQAADDAVDEILSNWFANRKQGTHSHVTAYGHVSQPTDITIPATTTFYKDEGLLFVLDNNGDDLFIPASDLVSVFDVTGEITEYIFSIPLVADLPGTEYDVVPGTFAGFDAFNPYVTRVETLETGTGGDGVEKSTDYVSRAANLITVRNLINARSNDAVLRDEFQDIRVTTTIGMGDPEMIRDRIKEDATGLEMNVGGHMDTFVSMPRVTTSFTGVVGAKFDRPDGKIVIFRDSTYANGTTHKFTDPDPMSGSNIVPGMVLRIRDGLPIKPHDYMIREVLDDALIVSERVPFVIATDELGPPDAYVKWSIGQRMPSYDDVVIEQAKGKTSKKMQRSGRITFPGGPLYEIQDVTIDDPADPDSDPEDNLVHLNVRSNTVPVTETAPDNEYQVVVHNPEAHQSVQDYSELLVGTTTDLSKYDGKTCKVTYTTLNGFSDVSAYVLDLRRRVAAESPLVRAYHPAYISFTVEYSLSTQAVTDVSSDSVVDYLVKFINAFDPREILSINVIMDAMRKAFPSIGSIYPFTLYYDVHIPDGRVIEFASTEKATVPWDVQELSDVCVSDITSYDGLDNPADLGLSDDVVQYIVLPDAVSVIQR